MIDFRYHIVSIVAVFLALGLGIVIGTYTINSQVLDNIRNQVKNLRSDNDGLRDRVRALENDVGNGRSFVTSIAPMLLDSRLARQRVVIVVAPDASQDIARDVAETVQAAGAAVTGTVRIAKDWTEPAQSAVLASLAEQLVEPGVNLPDGTAYDRAGRVLATALLDSSPASIGADAQLSPAETTALAGFEEADLISLSPNRPGPATLAVVVAADAPDEPTDADSDAVVTLTALARELGLAGSGAVVVGPREAAETGGLVSSVRRTDEAKEVVSSVDDGDTVTGQVRTALALAAEVRGVTGQYGVGPGADRPAPTPAPTRAP